MDNLNISALLRQPIRLSVSLEEAETTKALKEELRTLKEEHTRLLFSYTNCTKIIERFRDFCKEEEIPLPDSLSFVTPWERSK